MSTRNSNGFWRTIDQWGDRIKLICAVLLIFGAAVFAWANVNNRVADVDKRLTVIERVLVEQITPMRDDVLIIKRDVQELREERSND